MGGLNKISKIKGRRKIMPIIISAVMSFHHLSLLLKKKTANPILSNLMDEFWRAEISCCCILTVAFYEITCKVVDIGVFRFQPQQNTKVTEGQPGAALEAPSLRTTARCLDKKCRSRFDAWCMADRCRSYAVSGLLVASLNEDDRSGSES